MIDVILGAKILKSLIVKLPSIISDDGMRNPKSTNNTVLDKFLNLSFSYVC